MMNTYKKLDENKYFTLGILAITTLFTGLVFLAIYIPLEIRVIAPAEVIGNQDIVEIRALSSGVVRKINVVSGQQVEAGDTLIELENNELKKQISITQSKLQLLRCRIENLENELSLLSENTEQLREMIEIAQVSGLKKFLDFTAPCQLEHGEARSNELFDTIRLRLFQIENLNVEKDNLDTQIELTSSLLDSLDNDVVSRRRLAEQDVVSGAQLRSAEREYTNARISMAQHTSRRAKFEGQISEVKAQANVEISVHISDIADEIRASRIRESDESSRLINFQNSLAEKTIRSPVKGTVIDINSFVISNYAEQSELLMKLAPISQFNLLKAKVAAEDIDNISIDGNVKVRFPTYADLRDLLVSARIQTINPIKTNTDTDGNRGENSFEVILNITEDRFLADGETLRHGTPAEILFAAEKTTFAGAIMRPITQNWPKIFEE